VCTRVISRYKGGLGREGEERGKVRERGWSGKRRKMREGKMKERHKRYDRGDRWESAHMGLEGGGGGGRC